MNLIKKILQILYLKLFILTKYFFVKKKFGSNYYYLNLYFIFYNTRAWINNHKLLSSIKIRKKTIFFDVGAHIGLVQLLLMKQLKNSKKFLFEPNKTNFKFLNSHIKKNKIKNIELYNVAISNKNGFVNFEQTKTVSAVAMIRNTVNSKKIKSLNLDFFYKKNIIPDFIKIDVEGHELSVLQGAKRLLKHFNPTLILSIHPKNLKNHKISLLMLKEFLEKYSYNIESSDYLKLKKMKNMEVILSKKISFN